jgi:hypothetical protein
VQYICKHSSPLTFFAGGQLVFEHRNLGGEGRQLVANINTQNFLSPADDLGFRVDYKHPYIWGSGDVHRASLNVSAFNSRKLSGVFPSGTYPINQWWQVGRLFLALHRF